MSPSWTIRSHRTDRKKQSRESSVRNSFGLSRFRWHCGRWFLGIRQRSLFHRALPGEWLFSFLIRPPCYAPHGVCVENERGHPIDGLGFSILLHHRVRPRAGFWGDAVQGARGIRVYEGQKEGERASKKHARETRVVQRGRGSGDFEHAPQPPRFFSPGTEKGDRARHMPGGARVPVAYFMHVLVCVYETVRKRASRSRNLLASNENESARAIHSCPLILDYSYYGPCYFESYAKVNPRAPTVKEMFRKFARVVRRISIANLIPSI